jgi:hypothetical protein
VAKLFKVYPKRNRHQNGIIITPDMSVVVTTKMHTLDSFNNGAVEVKEAFLRLYCVDIKKGCFVKGDFEVETLN